MKWLNKADEENTRLKRLSPICFLARRCCRTLSSERLKACRRRRELVEDRRVVWDVSIRRAYGVIQTHRSTFHYNVHADEQVELNIRIKEIVESWVRYGYRRIHVFLRREDWLENAKPSYHLYNQMGLQLRNSEAVNATSPRERTTPKRPVKARLKRHAIPQAYQGFGYSRIVVQLAVTARARRRSTAFGGQMEQQQLCGFLLKAGWRKAK